MNINKIIKLPNDCTLSYISHPFFDTLKEFAGQKISVKFKVGKKWKLKKKYVAFFNPTCHCCGARISLENP